MIRSRIHCGGRVQAQVVATPDEPQRRLSGTLGLPKSRKYFGDEYLLPAMMADPLSNRVQYSNSHRLDWDLVSEICC